MVEGEAIGIMVGDWVCGVVWMGKGLLGGLWIGCVLESAVVLTRGITIWLKSKILGVPRLSL
jgi:hypothetical protein